MSTDKSKDEVFKEYLEDQYGSTDSDQSSFDQAPFDYAWNHQQKIIDYLKGETKEWEESQSTSAVNSTDAT